MLVGFKASISRASASASGLPDKLVTSFIESTSRRATGHALGNGLSTNILERLVGRVLYASGTVDQPVADWWQHKMPKLIKKEVRSAVFQRPVSHRHVNREAWKHIASRKRKAMESGI